MTLHLGTPKLGTNQRMYFIDQSSWALDKCCPSVHKGRAAIRTSNNLSFHDDAERQWKKGSIKVTEFPQNCPLPDCLLNSASSLSLFSFALDTTPFLTSSNVVVEYTRIFCTLTQAGLPSQKTPLSFDQQISSHLPDSRLIVLFSESLSPGVYQSPVLVTLCRPFLMTAATAAAANALQSCLTLCDLIDGSPLGSPIPGILISIWYIISFSQRKFKMLLCPQVVY